MILHAGRSQVRVHRGRVVLDRIAEEETALNDEVVEGLRGIDVPAFTVQYHPEAAAGPHDADYLFDRFVELVEKKG